MAASVFTSPLAYPSPIDGGFSRQDLRASLSVRWHGELGQKWDRGTLFFAILSAAVYVVEAYLDQKPTPLWSVVVEIIVATFFTADYILRLFIAEHRWKFATSWPSVLDLLCILPVMFIFVLEEDDDDSPAADEETDPRKIVFFLQFLRVVRLIRILRGYRVVSVSKRGDPENLKKQIQILIYTLVALIFITAALLHLVEQYAGIPDLDGGFNKEKHIEHFHDAVYFVVITLTTVGFGDFVPRTIVARVLIMFFVVASVMLIPRETGKLAELMALTSPYAGSFQNKEGRPHVVVFGHIEFTNFKAFLTEFFHSAHGHHQMMVVAMSPRPPSKSVKLLFGEKGYYGPRVQYLEGSALDEGDLARIAYTEASACFLLVDRLSPNPQLADCETVMRCLSVKQIAPKVPVYAQIVLPESKPQLVTAGADHFVCLTELKMHILATASMVHGFSTLFCNLFRNEDEDYVFEEDGEEGHWLTEYCHGISYEIYSFDIPPAFYGRSFAEVSCFVYGMFGALMFGVQRRTGSSHKKIRRCLLNPISTEGDGTEFSFEPGDKGFLFAMDAGDSEKVANFTGSFSVPTSEDIPWSEPVAADEVPHVPDSLLRYEKRGRCSVAEDTTSSALMIDGCGAPGKDTLSDENMPPLVSILPPYTLPVDQAMDPTKQRFDATNDLDWSDSSGDEYDGFRPQNKYELRILNEVPRDMRGHIVLVAHKERFVINFASLLRTGHTADERRPIIALVPQVPEESVLRALHTQPHVYFVLGSGRDTQDFRRCNIRTAHTCVILFSGTIGDSRVSYPEHDDGEDMMADYDGLLAYTCLSSEVQRFKRPGTYEDQPFCILELVHKQNTRFIPPRPEERFGQINEGNDYIVPCYAGGSVYSDAVMDSLLCQVFYNNELLGVLSQFLCPDPLPSLWPLKPRRGSRGTSACYSGAGGGGTEHGSSPRGSASPRGGGMPFGFRSSRVFSMRMRKAFIGRTFHSVLSYMLLREKRLPIGMLRSPDRLRQGFFTAGAGGAVPYVFLCPPADTVLRKRDRLFVLSNNDPATAAAANDTGTATGTGTAPGSAATADLAVSPQHPRRASAAENEKAQV